MDITAFYLSHENYVPIDDTGAARLDTEPLGDGLLLDRLAVDPDIERAVDKPINSKQSGIMIAHTVKLSNEINHFTTTSTRGVKRQQKYSTNP